LKVLYQDWIKCVKYCFQPKKFICDQKLHGKQNVGGVKARLQNDDMDWSQKMWTHLSLGFSIVCMEAIMGGECFQLCMLCVLFGFFCVANFCYSWKLWGVWEMRNLLSKIDGTICGWECVMEELNGGAKNW
jgi:hypothetical protein